jgi:thiamine biosynthesis lipoprotein
MPSFRPVPVPAPLSMPLGTPRRRRRGLRVQRLRVAMGTWITIEAAAQAEPLAVAGIEAAYRALADVEWRLHPRRQGSELQRINSALPHSRIPIDASTWSLLQLAQAVHDVSDGAFDPCLPSHPGRLCDLTLSAPDAGSPWARCRVPLVLDLGGIAKGYAIDRAIAALRVAGCASGLVNAGGDLRVFGGSETVLLRHADGTCVPLTLADEALAVSDVDARQRPAEHQGYYRRSGAADPVRRYAAVVAECATVADALTKCVLLAEERCATRTLRAFRARRVG